MKKLYFLTIILISYVNIIFAQNSQPTKAEVNSVASEIINDENGYYYDYIEEPISYSYKIIRLI